MPPARSTPRPCANSICACGDRLRRQGKGNNSEGAARREASMAGHSKWSNIKHRKAAQDARRGKIFTRLIREIVIAARLGGGTIEDNPRLRAAVDKALAANMRKDTIENAKIGRAACRERRET